MLLLSCLMLWLQAFADAGKIEASKHWGQLTPWGPSDFGIAQTGLPEGCSYKQIHVLQRHTERLPSSSKDDSGVMIEFATKVSTAKSRKTSLFRGNMEFLNRWSYSLATNTLTARGAASSALLGAQFWARYGRLLYGKSSEARYNASRISKSQKPVFRTTNQQRMHESARWYFSGFFNNVEANSSSDLYDLVVIPEGGIENNTLAAYDSCPNLHVGDQNTAVSAIGTRAKAEFISRYAKRAHKRIAKLLPADFNLTTMDVFAMQSICAYETASLGQSDFCVVFSDSDWKDFDYALGLSMFHNYGYGNPTGRAQGLGYVQELLARIEHRTISLSNSSVNSTLDSTETQFGHFSQPIIFDGTHDAVIISVLTALGLKFFNGTMLADIDKSPRKPSFRLSSLTPFGAKLHTEIISCPRDLPMSWTPEARKYHQFTTYTQPDIQEDQIHYIRMKLNEGVLPMASDLGCNNHGSELGFCTLSEFLRVTKNVERNAQYDEVCYGSRVLGIRAPVGNGNLDNTNLN